VTSGIRDGGLGKREPVVPIPHPTARIPVLCYHRIGGALELGVTRVGRGVFARQMTALAKGGWRALTLDAVAQAGGSSQSASPNPQSAFLLSFDDGYASTAETAFPVLADLGFTAITFLVTDYIGRENTWDVRYTWRRQRHLDWRAIERWAGRGFSFQSHTRTHRRLTWLSDREAGDELARSRETLVQRLGEGAGIALAYPFGAADRRVRALAREAGYRMGFGAPSARGGDPFAIPRTPVYMWDAWDVPFGLREDLLGKVGRGVADVANQCAVGTSVMLGLLSRQQSAVSHQQPL